MKKPSKRLKIKRNIFGWLFVTSLVLFLTVQVFNHIHSKEDIKPIEPPVEGPQSPFRVMAPAPTDEKKEEPSNPLVSQLTIISLITSATSFIGFFSTTLIAWRKENREKNQAAINLKLKELEIRKLEAEIEKNKSA